MRYYVVGEAVVVIIHGEKEVMMPVYEYVCKNCGKEFTISLSFKEFEAKPEIKCAHCESNNVQRRFTGFFAKTSRKS